MRTCVRVRTHARARKHAFAHSEDENDEMDDSIAGVFGAVVGDDDMMGEFSSSGLS